MEATCATHSPGMFIRQDNTHWLRVPLLNVGIQHSLKQQSKQQHTHLVCSVTRTLVPSGSCTLRRRMGYPAVASLDTVSVVARDAGNTGGSFTSRTATATKVTVVASWASLALT